MIKTILIANRGEIAVRVIKTAKKMGIKTIAIYSDIDASALHVELADEAYPLGGKSAKESYLNGELVIDIAKKTQADAIHPGYGFLSEDSDFAALCEKSGLIFIGPSSQAISAMGSKSKAKQLMREHDVPMTPGYDGDNQDTEHLAKMATEIGFPVLLKASSGGGGKGMRLVEHQDELYDAIASAKREALASFSDGTLLIEKYVRQARHVEVQIFCDQHGNGVYLHDRDCSVQRRHQKVIEEAPAPNLSDKLREQMGQAALRAAFAINYCGAGTVEFLLDHDHAFYFMEMNTRLQVEHPVTEMITGVDLVEWQILAADGEKIELAQSDIPCHGHALEARICAEDPYHNFAPSSGLIEFLHLPTEEQGVIRVDSGIRMRDSISPYYDSMIAKVIAWGETRENAIDNLVDALYETAIVGPESNVGFVCHILQNPNFINANLSTQFIEQNETLFDKKTPKDKQLLLLALAQYQLSSTTQNSSKQESNSPWLATDHWQSGQLAHHYHFWQEDAHDTVSVHSKNDNQFSISINGREQVHVSLVWQGKNVITAMFNDNLEQIIAYSDNNLWHTFIDGEKFTYHCAPVGSGDLNYASGNNNLSAPMHANILDILVNIGDTVKSGDKIMLLEAMKMEHPFIAPFDGTISAIHFNKGDSVVEGDVLIDIEAS